MNYCQFRNEMIKRMANAGDVLDPIQSARQDIIDTCAANSDITITGATQTSISMAMGGSVYGGCMGASNNLYLIPRYGTKIAVIDTDSSNVSYPVTGLPSRRYSSCGLSGDYSNMYISPDSGAYVGKMDIATGQVSNIGNDYGTSSGKMYRVVTYQNKTYIFGTSLNTSVIIDNSNDSYIDFSWKYGSVDSGTLPNRPFITSDGVYVNNNYITYKISDAGAVIQKPETGTHAHGLGDFTMGYDGNYYSLSKNFNYLWVYDWNNHTITTKTNQLPSVGRDVYACAQLLPTGDLVYFYNGKIYYYKDGVRAGELCNVTPSNKCQMFVTNDKIYLVPADSGSVAYEISITYSRTPRYFKDETLISPINNRG